MSLFGFDQYSPEHSDNLHDLRISRDLTGKIEISKDKIFFENFRKSLKKGIIYDGGVIQLTPYENEISWGILETPQNAFLINN